MSAGGQRFPLAWFVIAAAGACAAATWLAWPGFLSSDAQAAYGQALAGSYDTVHPPIFAFTWRQLLRIAPGGGPLLVFLHALYFTGVALAFALAGAPPVRRTLGFIAVAAWPSLLVLLCHVWKDVAMSGALALAAALALAWRAHGWRGARAGAIALLLFAVACRHNAWPATLPFAWLLAGRVDAPRMRRAFVAGALAVLLLVFPALVVKVLGARERTIWPAIALWDLAAVSIDVDEQLLPASVVAPELDVPTLEHWFTPWGNPSLFASNLIMLGFYNDYTPAQLADMRAAWLAAVRDHPGAWWRHRWRVTRLQFGGFPAEVPSGLVYSGEYRVPEGVSPVVPPVRPARDALVAWTERARGGPWFWGVAYVVLAAIVFAWRQLRRLVHGLPGALALSALLYAAPLPLLAPGAEWRYLMWSVLAALLAGALALSPRRAS